MISVLESTSTVLSLAAQTGADMVSRASESGQRSAWMRYGAAIAAVTLGWVARQALSPGIGPTALPFIFFFPAIGIAAWYGGLRPGLLSILLSALAANWFFVEPAHTFRIESGYDAAALLAFVLASFLIVIPIESMHRARVLLLSEISERKQKEHALSESEALLSAVLKQLPVGLGVLDKSGRWTLSNAIVDDVVPKGIPSTLPDHMSRWRAYDADGRPVPPEDWPGRRALRGETVSPGLEKCPAST